MVKIFILVVIAFQFSFASSIDSTSSTVLTTDSDSTNILVEQEFSPLKFGIFTGAATLTTTYLFYTLLSEAWWNNKSQTPFHFKDDLTYVSNYDKLAHYYGGYAVGSLMADGLMWSGLSPHASYASAWGYSTVVQLVIDIKDGYSEGFGFSKWDVIAGSFGGATPWIEYAIWGHDQEQVDLKFSYYTNSSVYEDEAGTSLGFDDYTNQTMWVSFYPFLKSKNYFNRIFGIAIGFSMDEGRFTRGYGEGKWEVYLALDYNIEEMFFSKKRSPFIKGLLRYLNHLKLPSPTVQVYPVRSFKLTYPIEF